MDYVCLPAYVHDVIIMTSDPIKGSGHGGDEEEEELKCLLSDERHTAVRAQQREVTLPDYRRVISWDGGNIIVWCVILTQIN